MIDCDIGPLPPALAPPTYHPCTERRDWASIASSEKKEPSSPDIYDGSTVASKASPSIPRCKCTSPCRCLNGRASHKSHFWHQRLARTRKPKPQKKTIIRRLEDHPIGYPRQAAFADSDECFMIYRRFGYIHSRLLMHRQDELRELEEELSEMDKRDSKNPDRQLNLQCREIDDDDDEDDEESQGPYRQSRSALFNKIEEKA